MDNPIIPRKLLFGNPDKAMVQSSPENNLSFHATAEELLASCLGGHFEPVGDDFQNSSIQVLAGKEYVPGLRESL